MVSLFLQIDIETDAVDGKLLLAECSRLFHESLRGPIEGELRRAAAVGSPDVEISRMVLDLGDLSAAHWRRELGERLVLALAKELALVAKSGEHASQGVVSSPSIRYPARVAAATRRDVSGRSALSTRTVVAPRAVASKPERKTHANVTASGISGGHKTHADVTTRAISGGGLVLLWPFLARLWSAMGYVENGGFRDVGSRFRAVACLDWLIGIGDSSASGSSGAAGSSATGAAMSHPTASRLICGLALDSTSDQPLDTKHLSPALTDMERSQLTTWRDSLPVRLPGLGRCVPGDITSLFLQRPGTVRTQNGAVTLHVERDASDILLRSIPWPMQQLVLPWLEKPLNIDWL